MRVSGQRPLDLKEKGLGSVALAAGFVIAICTKLGGRRFGDGLLLKAQLLEQSEEEMANGLYPAICSLRPATLAYHGAIGRIPYPVGSPIIRDQIKE